MGLLAGMAWALGPPRMFPHRVVSRAAEVIVHNRLMQAESNFYFSQLGEIFFAAKALATMNFQSVKK